jgi:hypothetical protein
MNPHAAWPGNDTTTTPKENPMAAPDPKPPTRRDVAEMIRAERRETRTFVVAELATTRRRLARLEARLFLGAGEPDYIDSHAARVAAAFDPDAEEE